MKRYMHARIEQRELTLREYREQAASIVEGICQRADARIGRTANVTYAQAWRQLAQMKEKMRHER